jgi:hypothetical protein
MCNVERSEDLGGGVKGKFTTTGGGLMDFDISESCDGDGIHNYSHAMYYLGVL